MAPDALPSLHMPYGKDARDSPRPLHVRVSERCTSRGVAIGIGKASGPKGTDPSRLSAEKPSKRVVGHYGWGSGWVCEEVAVVEVSAWQCKIARDGPRPLHVLGSEAHATGAQRSIICWSRSG
jgi:hypothetical protein